MRRALFKDVPTVERIVGDAYQPYIARIGRRPAPMHADYASLIAENAVWVLEEAGVVAGLLVAHIRGDHLFIENVAVDPARQGGGHGQQMRRFAELLAVEHRLAELRLYTNELMTENIDFYARQGYIEIGRGVAEGFSRIYFRKQLPPEAAGIVDLGKPDRSTG